MSVFEKAVTEVRQGQEAFHNNLNNTNNSPPERDITYFNRTLVSNVATITYLYIIIRDVSGIQKSGFRVCYLKLIRVIIQL